MKKKNLLLFLPLLALFFFSCSKDDEREETRLSGKYLYAELIYESESYVSDLSGYFVGTYYEEIDFEDDEAEIIRGYSGILRVGDTYYKLDDYVLSDVTCSWYVIDGDIYLDGGKVVLTKKDAKTYLYKGVSYCLYNW